MKFGFLGTILSAVWDDKIERSLRNDPEISIILGSAEEFLSEQFINVLKDQNSQLCQRLALVVVDECHIVECW